MYNIYTKYQSTKAITIIKNNNKINNNKNNNNKINNNKHKINNKKTT